MSSSFPSPFEIEGPADVEGWEELYPYSSSFSEYRKEYEDNRFWFWDSMHWGKALTPWDATFMEVAIASLSQMNSRHYRIRVTLSAERNRVRASAFDLDGYKPRVYWVLIDENGERCIRRRSQSLVVEARAGMWDLIVEVTERAAEDGQMLILIARDPR